MKRKAQAPTLFSDMASEAEPLFGPPAVEVVDYGPFVALRDAAGELSFVVGLPEGKRRWIEARAAVLERFRGLSKWAAWAKACEEFDLFQAAE